MVIQIGVSHVSSGELVVNIGDRVTLEPVQHLGFCVLDPVPQPLDILGAVGVIKRKGLCVWEHSGISGE